MVSDGIDRRIRWYSDSTKGWMHYEAEVPLEDGGGLVMLQVVVTVSAYPGVMVAPSWTSPRSRRVASREKASLTFVTFMWNVWDVAVPDIVGDGTVTWLVANVSANGLDSVIVRS